MRGERPIGGLGAVEGRAQLLLCAFGLIPVLLYLGAEISLIGGLGFPLDDSWIHLQFARNLAQGHGLSYNPGELVTGSTAPLWTALLSLVQILPGNVVAWTKLWGVVLHLLGIVLTFRLARELGLAVLWAFVAGGMTALTYWLVWSALSGMEIPLFVVLSLYGLILHLRERRDSTRPPLALGVLGVAALARPEGLLLIVAAAADSLLRLRRGAAPGDEVALARPDLRRLGLGIAMAALAVLPTLLFFQWIGGSPFPNTLAAKTAPATSWLPKPQYLHLVLGIFFKPQPYLTLLAVAGIAALFRRQGTSRDRGLLLALWVLGVPLAYSLMSPLGRHLLVGNFGRYFFPLFPVVVVLGTLGAAEAGRGMSRMWRAGGLRLPVAAILAALLAWPTAATLVRNGLLYSRNVANVQDSDVAMGLWMRENLPPEALVAVEDIGAMKYFSPQPILDMVGLVSPELLEEVRAAVSPTDPAGSQGVLRYLEKTKPDFVIVYPNWHPEITQDPRLVRPIHRLQIPDNITMAGDEMVVYVTAWSRYHPPPQAAPPAASLGAATEPNADAKPDPGESP